MIASRKEAEDYVYASYLKAQPYLRYEDPDRLKRHPELVAPLISALSDTPAVVVTGSKGKGSTCAMIDALLSRRLKVGRLTSPHLLSFNERIRVEGVPITDEEFVRVAREVERRFGPIEARLRPGEFVSPMAVQVACAQLYFAACQTDVNVLECGKGARFDDVNSVPHAYAVITPILLEHTRELGSTLAEIAVDKAHVMQEGQRGVFVGRQVDEVLSVIESRAAAFGIPLHSYGSGFFAYDVRLVREGTCFAVQTEKGSYRDLRLPLLGRHQAENAALALALSEELLAGSLPEREVRAALSDIVWPGRMEILSPDPFLLLDACINRASCRYVLQVLNELGIGQVRLVVCIPSDKDYVGVVAEMAPLSRSVTLTQSHNPHYRFSADQAEAVSEHVSGVAPRWVPSLDEAIAEARAGGDAVVILGTTSAVGEVKALQQRCIW